MSLSSNSARVLVILGAAATGFGLMASSFAQNAPSAGPSPAKQAVENRRAAFTLIGNSFRWFGGVAKGAASYDEAEATKRAGRIAFLVDILDEGFPEDSNLGEPASKANAEIWTNRADFDKKLAKFKADARAFKETIANEKSATEGFKSAVALLGQDCKSCHDSYKLK
jgi:cytochrome c556